MAEFQEVMKQRSRMCNHYLSTDISCENCPLDKAREGTMLQCFRYIAEYYQKSENVIMKWAADHPEPVYPSFLEWLHKVLPNLNGQDDHGAILELIKTSIPADIAEKLGVEPK